MVERVDRLTSPPAVGRFYMVPTVRWKAYGMISEWPVRGPLHEDGEHLAFPDKHYHLDHRFFTAREADHIISGFSSPERNAAAKVCVEFRWGGSPEFERLPAHPTWRRRRCARQELRWPADTAKGGFHALHTSYLGQQCQRNASGWVCPHRNYPLGSAAVTDGVIVCPLHGLRIDAETGRVLPTHVLAKENG